MPKYPPSATSPAAPGSDLGTSVDEKDRPSLHPPEMPVAAPRKDARATTYAVVPKGTANGLPPN